MTLWARNRILILGMTYPSYSTKYVENVCTGGIEEGTSRMVRIHPLPVRYLEPGQRFKKFQWITADFMKHPSDPRPESLRIEPNTIEVGEVIPPKDVEERRRLVESSPHMVKSVEELHDRYKADGTSLGTVRPKAITKVHIVPRSQKERAEWVAKEQELLNQTTLAFERPPKPLDFPEVEFCVSWICDDARCSGHDMNLLQWGIHELYRTLTLKNDPERDRKVLDKMNDELDLAKRDVFLFLGNFRGRVHIHDGLDHAATLTLAA